MLEGGTAGGCSILYTLEIRLRFRMIIGASRVLLFRRWRGFAGPVVQREEKDGLVCLCGFLFWRNVFGERGAAFCCRSDGEEISFAICFTAGEGRIFADGECFVGSV
jgi:hypothetical protein